MNGLDLLLLAQFRLTARAPGVATRNGIISGKRPDVTATHAATFINPA